MAQYIEAVGRRKESTARVRVFPGSGSFTVNEKPLTDYFPRAGDAPAILNAIEVTGQSASSFDVTVKVQGGGISGQRDAVKLGLARALVAADETVRQARSQARPQGPDLHQALVLVPTCQLAWYVGIG